MEKLIYKKQKFVATLGALERSISVFYRKDIDSDVKACIVAGIIKHYEMAYEAAWKFLQRYLDKRYFLQVDSPKKVFRECYRLEPIDQETTIELLDIIVIF